MRKGATIGVVISLLAWLIPIVHPVSGSVGAFVGGYMGSKALEAPDPLKALGIGMTMGAVIAVATAGIIGIMVALFGFDTFWLIAAPIAGIWTAGLGMLGALVGSRSVSNET